MNKFYGCCKAAIFFRTSIQKYIEDKPDTLKCNTSKDGIISKLHFATIEVHRNSILLP